MKIEILDGHDGFEREVNGSIDLDSGYNYDWELYTYDGFTSIHLIDCEAEINLEDEMCIVMELMGICLIDLFKYYSDDSNDSNDKWYSKNSNDDFWRSYAAKFLFQEIPILKHNLDQHFCTTGNSK